MKFFKSPTAMAQAMRSYICQHRSGRQERGVRHHAGHHRGLPGRSAGNLREVQGQLRGTRPSLSRRFRNARVANAPGPGSGAFAPASRYAVGCDRCARARPAVGPTAGGAPAGRLRNPLRRSQRRRRPIPPIPNSQPRPDCCWCKSSRPLRRTTSWRSARCRRRWRRPATRQRQAVAKGWRVFKADEADAKGNTVYVHVLLPAVPGFDYRCRCWSTKW